MGCRFSGRSRSRAIMLHPFFIFLSFLSFSVEESRLLVFFSDFLFFSVLSSYSSSLFFVLILHLFLSSPVGARAREVVAAHTEAATARTSAITSHLVEAMIVHAETVTVPHRDYSSYHRGCNRPYSCEIVYAEAKISHISTTTTCIVASITYMHSSKPVAAVHEKRQSLFHCHYHCDC